MERLMQFIWQHHLWDDRNLTTADGQKVTIIHPGILNENAGPDFFNASVEINGQRWYGNIEIHVRASDWYRHGHDHDHAYDTVILHVVQTDDAQVFRPDGSVIPQITVPCSPDIGQRCNAMMQSAASSLPCLGTIRSLPPVYVTEWITALGLERLYMKSDRILDLVKFSEGDWESAAYITLARALGFGLNSQPFETLAKNLPLRFLNRHRDDLLTMEALIFGQAGLIPEERPGEDPYITRMRQEFRHMAHKFSLTPLPIQWKMARTRPQNFPHRRLAFLAQRIHKGFSLIGALDDIVMGQRRLRESSLREAAICYGHCEVPEVTAVPSLDSLRKVFDIPLTGFWASRYTFDSPSPSVSVPGTAAHADSASPSPRVLSRSSIDRLLINVAIPLLLARATSRGDVDTMADIPELLRGIAAEDNRDVRLFASAGVTARDAFDTQAIIQLRREYCEQTKCIYCRFGRRMFTSLISPSR